jgi:hypothetical protein
MYQNIVFQLYFFTRNNGRSRALSLQQIEGYLPVFNAGRIPKIRYNQKKKHAVAKAMAGEGGERGIRTPGTFYSTPDFESGTLNRSDISPVKVLRAAKIVKAR